MSLTPRFPRLARVFKRLTNAFRKAPSRSPRPARHSLNPQFSTIREVIYHTWDMHEQAQVVVTLVLDRDQGLHIFMANTTHEAAVPSLHDRVLNILASATGIIMAAVRGAG
ncbi:MAG: hypothetical protein HY014_09525 [Acidobacteria bacterium]|nr:hypothetical protein [Acidobacteriota bacterium]MBI3488394.1 hypothetical protein [Acidobacteriota bacterium]